MTASPPVGIIGFGHFGRALGSLLAAVDRPYLVHDPALAGSATLADLASGSAVIVLCVPVPATEAVLRALRPHLTARHLVMDVGSVKLEPTSALARVLGDEIPWCGTHPLFGPAALTRNERPLRAVVCPNPQHPQAHQRAREFYQHLGCEVIEQTPDEHDRIMADTHALAFFVARAMLDIGAANERAFAPPSFRAMAQTIDTVRVDAGHLFSVIQLANPHAAAARQRLLSAMMRIDAELRTAARGDEAATAVIEIPVPSAASTGLSDGQSRRNIP